MQRGIQAILSAATIEDGIFVPEHQYCKSFVDFYYSLYDISYMVSEGVRLTKALIALPKTFGTVTPQPTYTGHPTPTRPQPGDGTRGRINRQGSGFKR